MLAVFIGLAGVVVELAAAVPELAARAAAVLGQVVVMGLAALPILVGAVERTGVIVPVFLAEQAAAD
jgi:hypothetical protein